MIIFIYHFLNYINPLFDLCIIFLLLIRIFNLDLGFFSRKMKLTMLASLLVFLSFYIKFILFTSLWKDLMLYTLIGVVSILFIHKVKRFYVILTYLSFVSTIILTRLIFIKILSIFDMNSDSFISYLYNIIINFVCIVSILIFYNFFVHFKLVIHINLPQYYELGILLVFIINLSFILIVEYYHKAFPLSMQLVFYLGFLITVLILFYFLYRITIAYDEAISIKLLSQQQAIYNLHIMEIKDTYKSLCMLRHELKNQIFYMETLFNEQAYADLGKYFKKLNNSEPLTKSIVDTGNFTINSIMDQKISYAKSLNIPVHFDANLPVDLNIESGDLFSILANLFDNALDGTIQTKDPWIQIEMKIVKAYFSIIIANHTESDVLDVNPKLNTTKPDQKSHGIGIKVIQSIAEKYNGITNFSSENNRFVASVLLKINS